MYYDRYSIEILLQFYIYILNRAIMFKIDIVILKIAYNVHTDAETNFRWPWISHMTSKLSIY